MSTVTDLDSTPLPAGHVWHSEAEALHQAACSCVASPESPDYPERVGRRAWAEQCCIWHAAHAVTIEAYESGEIPTDRCERCGGRNYAGSGNHCLCDTRAHHGRPTPRLDVVDSMTCDCGSCRKGRSAG